MTNSASNPYFNSLDHTGEQDLIESLIVETIAIHGHNVYYCPRSMGAKDEVYGEDDLSTYDSSYTIDMYIRSYDSYEGDGTFLSKFNLEIRDQITFSLARRTFRSVTGDVTGTAKPREGDLIYSKMMRRLFIIKYVNEHTIFFQAGTLQSWDIVCEVFEYSNERLNTGITEIDEIETRFSPALATTNTEFDATMSDVFATNEEFQTGGASIVDWTDSDPFSDGNI